MSLSQATKNTITSIYAQYHHKRYLGIDPLCRVTPFRSKRDRELAGLIAATLSYGRVELIIKAIDRVFIPFDGHPYNYIIHSSESQVRKDMKGFGYRFNKAKDVVLLIKVLREILIELGSIEKWFYSHHGECLQDTLSSFVSEFRARAADMQTGKLSYGFTHMLPSPASGGASKRLLMYLRWMIRPKDGIDFGCWKGDSSQLVIPLDTHVEKISRRLGLLRNKGSSWKCAVEITENLKEIDPLDPVRFDFSLCRWGMMEFRKR